MKMKTKAPIRNLLSAAAFAPAALLALAVPGPLFGQGGGVIASDLKLLPGDGAGGDLFACALSASGETAVLGSILDDDRGPDSGSCYVFSDGDQGWSETAKVTAGNGAAGDQFGFSVGLSRPYFIAGAPFADRAGDRSGTAYVFFSAVPGAGWSQVAELTPAGAGAFDEIGWSVAISGNFAAIGAPGDDDRGSAAGAVYVYENMGGTWILAAKLSAADGAAGDAFGFSVSLDGGTLWVGAPFEDQGGDSAGAAYVFSEEGGTWQQQAKVIAADAAPSSLFGYSVSVSGDGAAIGARLDDRGGANSGAAYLFRRAGAAWVQEARLRPAAVAAGDELGISVSLAGAALVAGARFDDGGGSNVGAAYLFLRAGGAWSEGTRLAASDPGSGDELGFAVGVAGDSVIAGAFRDDDLGADSGSAYVFEDLIVDPPTADLSITKTDFRTAALTGELLTYTLELRNSGPEAAIGARVTDTIPPELTGAAWSCVASVAGVCGAGSGAIDDTATVPVDGLLTYTLTATVIGAAPGIVTNQATVAPPVGVEDPDLSNNTAVDTTAIGTVASATADLSISKTDGLGEGSPGDTLVYTIEVRNFGPSMAVGARVTDTLPPQLGAATWSCTPSPGGACGAGSGDIEDTVTLPVGGLLTYGLTATITAAAGTVSNMASVINPPGVPDPVAGNNFATDLTDIVPSPATGDLAVTIGNGPGPLTPGTLVTYTVAVSNVGPDGAVGAPVTTTFPPELAGLSWTCAAAGGASCAPLGTGAIIDAAELPPGSSATYTLIGLLDPAALGSATASATVGVPADLEDPDLSNNTAIDTDVLVAMANLFATKSLISAGPPLRYRIEVTNAGPSVATGVVLSDPTPAGLAFLSAGFPCAAGFPCGLGTLAPGDPPVALEAIYDVVANPGGPIVNTASVTSDVPDPDPDDNTGVTVGFSPGADLSITKTVNSAIATPPDLLTYFIEVTNAGPFAVVGGQVSDPFPAGLTGVVWFCIPPPGANCAAAGAGPLLDTIDLPAGSTLVYQADGTLDPAFFGVMSNAATVTPATGMTDPSPTNNQAVAETLVFPVNGGIVGSKRILSGSFQPGSLLTYEIVLINGNPGPFIDAPGPELSDPLPPELSIVSAVADSGAITIFGNPGDERVEWDGDLPPMGVVTITIVVLVDETAQIGDEICNQGFVAAGGTLTDDPTSPGDMDLTCFPVAVLPAIIEIPTLSGWGLVMLVLLLIGVGWRMSKRTFAAGGRGARAES